MGDEYVVIKGDTRTLVYGLPDPKVWERIRLFAIC